tara:strand:+ start:367 stop:570 length:204 start_codon:yes stop_codon:yes gene_type:complete
MRRVTHPDELKVGDLVECPTIDDGWDFQQNRYIGVVTQKCGHKVDISGGPQGTEVWDMFDLTKLCED